MLLGGLVLFGAGTWIAVSVSITQQVDQELRSQIDALRRFVEMVPDEELGEELREFAMGAADGNLLRVRDSAGHNLLGSALAESFSKARPGFDEVAWNGRRYRVISGVSF